MSSSKHARLSIGQRLLHEFGEFAMLTTYFYVAFVTVAFFKATVLHAYGVYYIVWGAAILKALLIAKFMMVGQSMKIGEGYRNAPLIKPILHKVFGFLLLLLALTSLETILTGLLHHHSISTVFHQLLGKSFGETLAEVFILLLVLIPFIGFSVLAEALGEGKLRKMLFSGVAAPDVDSVRS